MRQKAQHAYTWKHFYELQDLFREYLEHRSLLVQHSSSSSSLLGDLPC